MKTTITGIVGIAAYFLAKYGINLGPDVQQAIVVVTIFLVGVFAKDAGASSNDLK